MTTTSDIATLLASVDATALLAELLKKSDAKAVRAALKKAEASKPTTISLTMGYIVEKTMLGEPVGTTDMVQDHVTSRGRECGIYAANEKPQASTIAALVRYAQAHDDAYATAGYVPVLLSDVASLGGSVVNGRLYDRDGTRMVPDAVPVAPAPAPEPLSVEGADNVPAPKSGKGK